jgi:hypothetical protein
MNGTDEDRIVAYGQQRKDDLRIPDTWWKGATEEEQEVLRQMRDKLKARLHAHREHPTAQQQQLPQQYRAGQHAQVENSVEASAHRLSTFLDDESGTEDEDSAVRQLGQLETQLQDVFGGVARISEPEEVRCHLE